MNNTYLHLSNPKPTEEQARAIFVKKFGVEPKEVLLYRLHVLAGPVPEVEPEKTEAEPTP